MTQPGYLHHLWKQDSLWTLEGFPDDQAAMTYPKAFRKFLSETGVERFYKFEGYPGVSVEEIKKALKVRNAFSNMLDEMQ